MPPSPAPYPASSFTSFAYSSLGGGGSEEVPSKDGDETIAAVIGILGVAFLLLFCIIVTIAVLLICR